MAYLVEVLRHARLMALRVVSSRGTGLSAMVRPCQAWLGPSLGDASYVRSGLLDASGGKSVDARS
ncbi:hypothetical protein [Kibdelosporangium philippinense]|uniref:hypothetical protein n=1 Tax=Kibdelosporangium philippinense TaxID=211113 RepID=UPI00360F37AE